jgi:hypothetical protein
MRQLSERFESAVRVCVGAEPIKQRLAEAWLSGLDSIGVGELPEPLRPEFRRLRQAMHAAEPQPHESPAHASVRKMSATEAESYTRSILQLARDLERFANRAASADEVTEGGELVFSSSPSVTDRLN